MTDMAARRQKLILGCFILASLIVVPIVVVTIRNAFGPPPSAPTLPDFKSLTLVESLAEGSGAFAIEERYAYAINGSTLDREEFRLLCIATKHLAKKRKEEDRWYNPKIYVYDDAAYADLQTKWEGGWLHNRDHVIASFDQREGGKWLMLFYDPHIGWDKMPEKVELP